MPDAADTTLVEITTEVVSAYLVQNHVPSAEIAALIASVHAAFADLGMPEAASELGRPKPHVSVRKSVKDEFIISFEDGKPYKSLKRHLSSHGLTPEAYREKWGLPSDYPMIAPAYARQRSELAKKFSSGSAHRWA